MIYGYQGGGDAGGEGTKLGHSRAHIYKFPPGQGWRMGHLWDILMSCKYMGQELEELKFTPGKLPRIVVLGDLDGSSRTILKRGRWSFSREEVDLAKMFGGDEYEQVWLYISKKVLNQLVLRSDPPDQSWHEKKWDYICEEYDSEEWYADEGRII